MKTHFFVLCASLLCLELPVGAQTISAGQGHSLSVCDDGTVRAWGINNLGQLGNGTNIASNIPHQVSALNGAVAVAGGGVHSLALKSNGTYGLNYRHGVFQLTATHADCLAKELCCAPPEKLKHNMSELASQTSCCSPKSQCC